MIYHRNDDDGDDDDDVVDDLDLERQVGADPTRGRRSPRSAICEMHSDFNDLVSECAVRPALMMMMMMTIMMMIMMIMPRIPVFVLYVFFMHITMMMMSHH